MQEVMDRIKSEIENNDIVIFMKGNKDTPMCGFSALVVQIFSHLGVKIRDINVLEDENIRQGIKQFSDWPTIPQIYVKGEFIGGSDIAKEMFQSGELKQLLIEKSLIAS